MPATNANAVALSSSPRAPQSSSPVAPVDSKLSRAEKASNLTGRLLSVGWFHLRLVKVLGVGAYGVVYLAIEDESAAPPPVTVPPPVAAPASLPSSGHPSFLSAVTGKHFHRGGGPGSSPHPARSSSPSRIRRFGNSLSTIVPHRSGGSSSSPFGTSVIAPPSAPRPKPQQLPKQYAVKVLGKTGLDARQRLFQKREIELHRLASGHPNVLTLHAVHETQEFIYVVLDFFPDGDLFAMITEKHLYMSPRPFPELDRDSLITSSFLQILEAVEHCHRLGISHRDLKPENMLCKNGGREIVLADFGLATRELKSSEWGCGSSFYMSPECQGAFFPQFGVYSTPHNDIWSCGVILINLTCGRNPWKQATMKDETFQAFVHESSGFLRRILPISRECEFILKRIFSLNPHNRPSLPELRGMVKAVRHWNMDGEDLAIASSAAREAAKGLFTRVPSPAAVTNVSRSLSWSVDHYPETAKAGSGSDLSTRVGTEVEWDLATTDEEVVSDASFRFFSPKAVKNPFIGRFSVLNPSSSTATTTTATSTPVPAPPRPNAAQHLQQPSLPARRGCPVPTPIHAPPPSSFVSAPTPTAVEQFYSSSSEGRSRSRPSPVVSPTLAAARVSPRFAPPIPRRQNPAEFALQPDQPLHVDPRQAVPTRRRAVLSRRRHRRSCAAYMSSSASSESSCASTIHSTLSLSPDVSDSEETEGTESQPNTPQKAEFKGDGSGAAGGSGPAGDGVGGSRAGKERLYGAVSPVSKSFWGGNEPRGGDNEQKGEGTGRVVETVMDGALAPQNQKLGIPGGPHARFARWLADVDRAAA